MLVALGRAAQDYSRPKNQASSGFSSSSRVNGRRCSPAAVLLGDGQVVLERRVRLVESVGELVPLEDVVLGARLARTSRCSGSTARPTAQTPPSFRSIQITTVSASPASSTPWSTRSAKRPRSDEACTPRLYNRPDAEARLLPPESDVVPLRARDRRRSGSPRTSSASTRAAAGLDEILQDHYVQNRLTPQQQARLLERRGDRQAGQRATTSSRRAATSPRSPG